MLFAAVARLATASDWDSAGRAWWNHIEYLASDDLEGRNVGSPGFEKAAQYMAAQFEAAGLKPGNGTSYFQPVNFVSTSFDPERSSLSLVRDGHATAIAVPGEAFLSYNSHAAHTLEAPLVFAGYGLTIPEAG